MDDKVAIAEEFWLALARNDREGAQEVVHHLKIPPVATPAFFFEHVEGEDEARRQPEPQGSNDLGALSPKAVSPDTPAAIVDAWNVDARVALVLVSKNKICGARVTDGDVNFLACAGVLERVGGTSCGWTTHKAGGKDAKGRQVLKMDLPPDGSKAYAIPLKASGSAVKRPNIFSRPVLPQGDLPFDVVPNGWEETLSTLKLRAREWKFFLEVYWGEEWLVALRRGGIDATGGEGTPPIPLVIPSLPAGSNQGDRLALLEDVSLEGREGGPGIEAQDPEFIGPRQDRASFFPYGGRGAASSRPSSVRSVQESKADLSWDQRITSVAR
jgi:hypothetical protein